MEMQIIIRPVLTEKMTAQGEKAQPLRLHSGPQG